MTNLEARPAAQVCGVPGRRGPRVDVFEAREVPLGGIRAMRVRRTLPQRGLPLVGSWCFLDEFGPQEVEMRVLPHPHVGLQTVTWPLRGEIRHRDSVGSDVVVRPGQLNLMTAGRGVAHSEFSVAAGGAEAAVGMVHAVQLWVVLPDGAADGPAGFEQVVDLPVWTGDGLRAVVMVGELGGARSPATVHTPLLGADVAVSAGAGRTMPLREDFEHALVVLEGAVVVDGTRVEPGPIVDLGDGRDRVRLSCDEDARVLLLGGAPFAHDVVMWWNFVGRDHDAVAQARADWESADRATRFGAVAGHDERIPAPELPNLRLRPRHRGTG